MFSHLSGSGQALASSITGFRGSNNGSSLFFFPCLYAPLLSMVWLHFFPTPERPLEKLSPTTPVAHLFKFSFSGRESLSLSIPISQLQGRDLIGSARVVSPPLNG